MKINPLIMALTLLALNSSLVLANNQSEVRSKNSKAIEINYDEFPKAESGIGNWISNKTGLAVTPENVIDRSFRAQTALEAALTGIEGKGLKYFIKKSECITWINLYRTSFVAGIRFGRGMASCRIAPESNIWSAPFYIKTGEVSAGAQIGLDQSDFFLFFPSKETMMNILDGNLTLDGNIALTVAKWGRSASAGTDIDLDDAEIKKDFVYSYALSRGAYAGIALEGGLMLEDSSYNEVAYKELKLEDISTMPSSHAPKEIRQFSNILDDASLPAEQINELKNPTESQSDKPTLFQSIVNKF